MHEKFNSLELNSKFQKVKLDELEKSTISRLGLSEKDIDEMLSGKCFAEGSYAMVFDVPNNKDMVAKVWKNPKNDYHRADYENVALRLLRLKKMKEAPSISSYIESPHIIFEKKVEGSPIEQIDNSTIKELAKVLSKIHSIKLNSYGKPLSERKKGTKYDCFKDGIDRLRQDLLSSDFSEDIFSFIEKIINKIENKAKNNKNAFNDKYFTLIHFDLNHNNILKNDDGRLVIVDWEQASAGDNAMDLAKMFLKLDFDEPQKKQFLNQYKEELKEKDNFLQDRLKIYEPLVIVNSLLWRSQILKSHEMNANISKYDEDFYQRVRLGYNDDLKKINDLFSNNIK